MLVYERGAPASEVQRCGSSRAARARWRPTSSSWPARVGRVDDPRVRQAIARAHINDYAQFHLGRRIGQPACGQPTNPDPASPRTASWPPGCSRRSAPGSRWRSVGTAALAWAKGDDDGAGGRRSTTSTAGRSPIAAGTNEMQRNGIGERVLGLPREPSFDTNKPFSEVVAEAADWTGKVG